MSAKTLVVRNGTLIDGSGKPASRNDAIVIEGEGRAVARVIAGAGEIGRSIVTTPGVPPERLEHCGRRFARRSIILISWPPPRNATRCLTRERAEMEAITRETMALPKYTVAVRRNVLQD
jgi:hypothetical protein